jgi:hypothetical protein
MCGRPLGQLTWLLSIHHLPALPLADKLTSFLPILRLSLETGQDGFGVRE